MIFEELGLVEWVYIISTIAILPAIIFGLVAQLKVSFAFNKYSQVQVSSGKTAAQLAEEMLRENAVDCKVELGHGHLTDHYDPRTKSVVLSPEVYHGNSVAAYGIAAHEVGHAIQDATNYAPLRIRHAVVKGTSAINKLLLPIIVIGMIAQIFWLFDSEILIYFIGALVIFYFLTFLISVITLPTEYNASNRAKEMLRQTNAMDENQQRGVRKVLSAAALTYLAGLVVSLVYFLRFASFLLILASKSRRR